VLCIQTIVPGFKIVLEANGKQYEYHTNADASIVVPAESPLVAADAQVSAAQQALANSLGVSVKDIKVISSAAVEWSDACLGIALPGVVCAEVVTPGFIVVLEARGRQYEYHTNQDANAVRPATVALTWRREGGIAGFCDDLTVYLSGEVHANWCKPSAGDSEGNLFAVVSQEELAQFNQWLTKYGMVTVIRKDPAAADAMTVTLTLNGDGKGQPTESEQKAMMDWAQALYTRLKP
jgi:hypothetical protein